MIVRLPSQERRIGFKAIRHHEENGEMSWGLLSFGNCELMLNEGGKPSTGSSREEFQPVL